MMQADRQAKADRKAERWTGRCRIGRQTGKGHAEKQKGGQDVAE